MEKIINVKSSKTIEILKTNIEIKDCLHMDFFKSTNNLEGGVLSCLQQFNSVIWDVKCNLIFPEINNIEDEEEKRKYLESSIEEHFSKLLSTRDIEYVQVNIDDIDTEKIDNESVEIAEQLSYFNYMPIPEKTKSFLQGYVDMFEEAEAPSIEDINLRKAYTVYAEPIREVEEYVMYIGQNPKYKGFVGKITGYREDTGREEDKAPNRITFIENSNGQRLANFWAKDSNIIKFYI